MLRRRTCWAMVMVGASSAVAQPALDRLLEAAPTTQLSSTQPAPTTQPASAPARPPVGRWGVVTLSDGTTLRGRLTLTPGAPLRVFDRSTQRRRELSLDQIRHLQAVVDWERQEREWHFPTPGSDHKVYTGRSYPARQTHYRFVLADGSEVVGDVSAPLYVSPEQGPMRRVILRQRDKGQLGQTLADLPYVQGVTLDDP